MITRLFRWLMGRYHIVLTLLLLAVLVIMITVQFRSYRAKKNPRVLSGMALVRASEALTAIEQADTYSETNTGDFAATNREARKRLDLFKEVAKGKEEQNALLVMTDLFNQIQTIPETDADAREAFKAAKAGDEDPLIYFRAIQRRELTLAIISTCTNESMTYIYPESRVPVDECHYRVTESLPTRK